MSDSNELKPNASPGTPVPDLIEQYRTRRDAWIAQADELARLRDEVRGSAEREAMEIVTAARRNVRQIVMEARRELLVLSAQVQAALGEAGARPDPTVLLNRGRETEADDNDQFTDAAIFAPEEAAVFAPEEAVKGMLDDARADMDALAEDARTVPFKALTEAAKLPPPPEPPSVFSNDTLLDVTPSLSPAPPSVSSTSSLLQTPAEISPAASRMLLSSPFPSDAVPVPTSGRARMFVALFGAAGIAILIGTIWWMRSGSEPAATEAARSTPPVSAPASSDAGAAASTTPPPAPSAASPAADAVPVSSALSLLVEARRSSWLRTTVDGQSDAGRMLAQGETVRLNAKQSVLLRVGDAGAVYVSVNNGQAAPLGLDGQVITRQFVVEANQRPQSPVAAAPLPPPTAAPPQAVPPQRTAPLSPPLAAGPSPAQTGGANLVPLVQPVAAAPPSPPFDPAPAPAPPPRAEPTVPPPAAPRAELPTPGPASPVSAVVTASRQWLEAYHRQDRAALAALQTEGLQLTDDRRNEERFPANVDVNRSLDRISVQIAADTAVLTAVMTERTSDNSVPPRVSPVSQVWQLRGNQWRVSQVRLVSEARLNQIFR
jgi:hypothetical protein